MTTEDQEQQARQLIVEISKGKQTALEAFYLAFESRVYCYALTRLNDSFEAADTLNEVMMEVWKYAGRFEGRSKVSTWLLGITHNKVYDRLRKRKKTNLQDDIDDYTNQLIDESGLTVEKALEGADNSLLIQRCMGKLSEAQKEVIHLAFFEDLHYQEIAGIVSCPEGTVKTRVYHAKQLLKSCISRLMDAMEPVL